MTARIPRVHAGNTIRLYGFPGTFSVEPSPRQTIGERLNDFVARSTTDPLISFPALDDSVVEIDGRPCCLRSCPIAPPAADYPHVPTFDYDDGPRQAASRAVDAWTRNR